jgi:hypothetical protein
LHFNFDNLLETEPKHDESCFVANEDYLDRPFTSNDLNYVNIYPDPLRNNTMQNDEADEQRLSSFFLRPVVFSSGKRERNESLESINNNDEELS